MSEDAASGDASYARGARILSIGIATTGLFTFAYFSVASYVLNDDELGDLNRLWTILFVAMTVFYRPVEQYLTRTIAATGGHPYRTATILQASFATTFLVAMLALHGPLSDEVGGSSMFWVLVVAAAAYAVSYFARGVFAGNKLFAFYGGLVFFEAVARFLFPVAVAIGIATGQTAVALGIAAAPIASLCVLPWALRKLRERHDPTVSTKTEDSPTSFALAVAAVQLGEQSLLNAGALIVAHGATAVVFAAFLITRIPLQLFQSIQTSMLPHLAGLSREDDAFVSAIRKTQLAVAGFGALVVAGLLVLGPTVMPILVDVEHHWSRWGLALIGLGMGIHLSAGVLTQAAYATGRATQAAGAWLAAAAVYVVLMAVGGGDELLRAEAGYAGCAALLLVLLRVLGR